MSTWLLIHQQLVRLHKNTSFVPRVVKCARDIRCHLRCHRSALWNWDSGSVHQTQKSPLYQSCWEGIKCHRVHGNHTLLHNTAHFPGQTDRHDMQRATFSGKYMFHNVLCSRAYENNSYLPHLQKRQKLSNPAFTHPPRFPGPHLHGADSSTAVANHSVALLRSPRGRRGVSLWGDRHLALCTERIYLGSQYLLQLSSHVPLHYICV